jgi:hypothetical protein
LTVDVFLQYAEKILDQNCSLKRLNCSVHYYLSSARRHLVPEFVSMRFLVSIRRLTRPSTRGIFVTERRQLKPLSNQIRSLAFTRGLPRQVKGAGLRTLSRRGSWVQIPPPAPVSISRQTKLFHFVSFGRSVVTNMDIYRVDPVNNSIIKRHHLTRNEFFR